MSAPLRARWAACALILLTAGTAPALQAQGVTQQPLCATPEPTDAEARQAHEAVRAWLGQHPGPRDGGVVTIPIAFHVIYSGTQGNVPDSWITAQIANLNSRCASLGYRFILGALDRTENAVWFFDARAHEQEMKRALAIEPARFLNFYTAQLPGGLLGWATFPNGDENSYLHGVAIHYLTMPGGNYPGYETGETAVHEVGHYVGLWHTFQGGCAGGDTPPGCETGGDQVCDTAAEAANQFGCPVGANTCATGGPDPVRNFMDYTSDACKTEFTPGQTERALGLMNTFRPTIMSNPAAFAAPDELDFEDVGLGQPATELVYVVNLSDAPLQITSITTDNDVFAADASSLTIPAGSGAEVEVTFTPDAEASETGTLSLATTNPDVGTMTVALEGRGLPLQPLLALPIPGVAASASAGGTATVTFTIENDGPVALEYAFTSIPPWITSITPDPGTVGPFASQAVAITLDAGTLGTGVQQDLLGLVTNDPNQDQVGLHVVFAVGGVFPPPVLTAPRYGAEDVPAQVVLGWRSVPGATSYDVEVSPEEDFSVITFSASPSPPTVVFTAELGTTLYWRVRAVNGSGAESDWSLPFTFTTTTATANEPETTGPAPSALGASYPNPARGGVTVPFTLGEGAAVTLRVYDVTGRLVAALAEGVPFGAGAHALRWETGAVPAGMYFVRFTAGEAAGAGRVVVLR